VVTTGAAVVVVAGSELTTDVSATAESCGALLAGPSLGFELLEHADPTNTSVASA